MKTEKKFCVMFNVYKTEKSKVTSEMKGPFAETPEAAVEALQAFLEKKGFQEHLLFSVFVAEKMDRTIAPCATSTFGYKDAQFDPLSLKKLLENQDLKVGTLWVQPQ
jgi:hypothetical protein